MKGHGPRWDSAAAGATGGMLRPCARALLTSKMKMIFHAKLTQRKVTLCRSPNGSTSFSMQLVTKLPMISMAITHCTMYQSYHSFTQSWWGSP